MFTPIQTQLLASRSCGCHTTLTNLFFARWGVTTVISFGIIAMKTCSPGVLTNYKIKKVKNWFTQTQSAMFPSVFVAFVALKELVSTAKSSFYCSLTKYLLKRREHFRKLEGHTWNSELTCVLVSRVTGFTLAFKALCKGLT